MYMYCIFIRLLYISQCIKAQTPPIRFLVDLLYNMLYDKSTTNQIPRWSLAHDLLWTCCTVRANHGREFTWRHITSCLILFAAVEFNDGERKRYCTRRSTRDDASISLGLPTLTEVFSSRPSFVFRCVCVCDYSYLSCSSHSRRKCKKNIVVIWMWYFAVISYFI